MYYSGSCILEYRILVLVRIHNQWVLTLKCKQGGPTGITVTVEEIGNFSLEVGGVESSFKR
jgi:hypothetical protein